jgi:hypothetical protein
MHLAIAPPATDAATTTGIDKSYTEFCTCDVGQQPPDDCCGPDTGCLSLRQCIIGPQPYLVKPSELFSIICCIVEKRYHPAREAANDAASLRDQKSAELTSLVNTLTAGIASFNTDARAAIPTQPKCCDRDYDAEKQPK